MLLEIIASAILNDHDAATVEHVRSIQDDEWIDASAGHAFDGPYRTNVFSVCSIGAGTISAVAGEHTYYKVVTESVAPPQGSSAPPWTYDFTPVGSTGQSEYGWSFTSKSLNPGESYIHWVEYNRRCDVITNGYEGYDNLSVPSVEHLIYGWYEGTAFNVIGHAYRENGSEAHHSNDGEISEDCDGHI